MLCKSFQKVNNNNNSTCDNNNNTSCNNKTSSGTAAIGPNKRQVSLTSISSSLTNQTIFQINCSVCGLKSSSSRSTPTPTAAASSSSHKLEQASSKSGGPGASSSRSAANQKKLIKTTQLLSDSSKHTGGVSVDYSKDNSKEGNRRGGVNRSSSFKKKKSKQQHKSTSFSLKFHKFSFASPYLKSKFDYSSKNKSISHKFLSKISDEPMSQKKINQRCCLAVSIVPFDKPGSKASADAKKNNVSHLNELESSEIQLEYLLFSRRTARRQSLRTTPMMKSTPKRLATKTKRMPPRMESPRPQTLPS